MVGSFGERMQALVTEYEVLVTEHEELQLRYYKAQQELQHSGKQKKQGDDRKVSAELWDKAMEAAKQATQSLKTALALNFGSNKLQRERHSKAIEKYLVHSVSEDMAAKAYDIFYQMSLGKDADCAGQQHRESRNAWLEARKAARRYLICCACLPHGTTEWSKVEQVLIGLFGEERVGRTGYDQQLRSQLAKGYDDEFAGERHHRHRDRPSRRQRTETSPDELLQSAERDVHVSEAVFPPPEAESTPVFAETAVGASMQHANVSCDNGQRQETPLQAQRLPVGVQVKTIVKNTFVDVCSEDECLSQGESAQSWPQVAGNLAESTQMIKKRAYKNQKERTLNPEITGRLDAIFDGDLEDSSAMLVSLVRSHAHDPVFVQKILDALEHGLDALTFLDKVKCLAQELPASAQSAVEICCRALGRFARTEAGSQIGSSIVTSLLHLLEYLRSKAGGYDEVRKACVQSILEVCREAREVFALGTLPHQVEKSASCFDQGLRTKLHTTMTAVSEQSPEIQKLIIMILARTQPIPIVLRAVGNDVDLLRLALSEVFWTLEESFVCLHQEHDDGGKARARQLLQRVMAQRLAQAPGSCMAAGWVRETNTRGNYSKMENRVALVGIVLGPEEVARLLSAATSGGDEELIAATSRALSIMCDDLADDVGTNVQDEVNRCAAQNRIQLRHMWSQGPMVGCVGSVNRSRAASEDPLLRKALESVIGIATDCIGVNWMNKAMSLHHEVLWTFENVFSGAPSLGAWEEQIHEVARPLADYWQSERDKDPEADREEVKIANLADKLLSWEIAPECTSKV